MQPATRPAPPCQRTVETARERNRHVGRFSPGSRRGRSQSASSSCRQRSIRAIELASTNECPLVAVRHVEAAVSLPATYRQRTLNDYRPLWVETSHPIGPLVRCPSPGPGHATGHGTHPKVCVPLVPFRYGVGCPGRGSGKPRHLYPCCVFVSRLSRQCPGSLRSLANVPFRCNSVTPQTAIGGRLSVCSAAYARQWASISS
jgi:hypothetical protein